MIRYRLDDLGWYQFEWLCQSLLKAEFGVGVESWGGHSDLGRDAYFEGSLPIPLRGINSAGPFLFQAKFVAEANAAGAKSGAAIKRAVSSECKSIKKRFNIRGIDKIINYVLMSNVPLTVNLRKEIVQLIKAVIPQCTIILWGSSDLCDMLDNVPNIRVAFPQILGLRDITELLASIVEKPIRERSTLSIEGAADLAQVFVPTEAYSITLQILSKYFFAVLTGPPEMGKTTIARIVGLAKLGEKWECFECRHPNDFLQMVDLEKPQIFVADDAFGSTEYRPDIAQAWAADLDGILRKIDSRHWLIWTSRPAPLKFALQRMRLQGKAEKFPEPAEVIVDASSLNEKEKALILYRHAKIIGLEKNIKNIIKVHAKPIIWNEHFTPERIRRFLNERLPNIISNTDYNNYDIMARIIKDEIDQPTRAMKQSFEALSNIHQRFLISMLDSGSIAMTKDDLFKTYKKIWIEQEVNIEQILEDLKSHFIKEIKYDFIYEDRYGWMHPSWRDLVIEFIINNVPSRREFLLKCGIFGILLALSGGGGREGKLQKPLLIDPEDWGALKSNIVNIIRSGDIDNTLLILTTIQDALRNERNNEIIELANDTLKACRQVWDEEKSNITANIIELYYSISEYIDPLPPGPILDHVWDIALNELNDELGDIKGEQFVNNMREWIKIINVILKNEPRFIRQKAFPKNYNEFINDIIEKVSDEIEVDHFYDEIDELTTEVGWLGGIKEIFKQMPKHYTLISKTKLLIDKIEWKESELTEELHDKVGDEGEEDAHDYRDQLSGGFDIERIFDDL